MSNPTGPDEKKIIVDEDWKSRVEAEREAASHDTTSSKSAAADDAETATSKGEGALPPPSLIYLAGTLYIQAIIGMGMVPNPLAQNKEKVDLVRAKHAIDTLAVLQEKTTGNRTAEESEQIDAMLHQLRMAFVEVKSATETAR